MKTDRADGRQGYALHEHGTDFVDAAYMARHGNVGQVEQQPDKTGVDFGYIRVEHTHDKKDPVEDQKVNKRECAVEVPSMSVSFTHYQKPRRVEVRLSPLLYNR